jgi:hypothetical protein
MAAQGPVKKVPILFYTMSVELARSSAPYNAAGTANTFCAVLADLKIKAKVSLVNIRREMMDKKKVMWLHNYTRSDTTTDIRIDITFKSAKYDQVRDVIDTEQMIQKGKVKKERDGDEEKSHLSLRLVKKQLLYLAIFEHNHYGIGVRDIETYLNDCVETYLAEQNIEGSYKINFAPYLSTDFLAELKKMKRKNVLSIIVDKDVFSDSDFMNLAGRNDIRDTVTITVGKKGRGTNVPDDLIKSMYEDVGKDKIRRLRVEGTNPGGSLKIDTDSMQLKHSLQVELTNDTHEVNTFDLFKKIQVYFDSMRGA